MPYMNQIVSDPLFCLLTSALCLLFPLCVDKPAIVHQPFPFLLHSEFRQSDVTVIFAALPAPIPVGHKKYLTSFILHAKY